MDRLNSLSNKAKSFCKKYIADEADQCSVFIVWCVLLIAQTVLAAIILIIAVHGCRNLQAISDSFQADMAANFTTGPRRLLYLNYTSDHDPSDLHTRLDASVITLLSTICSNFADAFPISLIFSLFPSPLSHVPSHLHPHAHLQSHSATTPTTTRVRPTTRPSSFCSTTTT